MAQFPGKFIDSRLIKDGDASIKFTDQGSYMNFTINGKILTYDSSVTLTVQGNMQYQFSKELKE